MESESSRVLNGRIGIVLQYIPDSERYEVKFGPEQVALLRADKLRKPSESNGVFVVGDAIEAVGLASAAGQKLNGQRGVVVQLVEATGRYEVRFASGMLTSLKPENLRKAEAACCAAPAASPAASPMSLAGLLGFGKKEDKKQEEPKDKWQSIWERQAERSGCEVTTQALTEEEQSIMQNLHSQEETHSNELAELRQKVVAEFAAVGVHDEGMIEEAYQQQLKEYNLKKVLFPKEKKQCGKRSRSRSSSSGSSSSSRSRSRSKRRATAQKSEGAAESGAC